MNAFRIILWGFAFLWIVAIFLFLVGQFGLFGQERDPLAGVFLIPLGLPWNRLTPAGEFSVVLAILAPGVNLLLLYLLYRRFSRKS